MLVAQEQAQELVVLRWRLLAVMAVMVLKAAMVLSSMLLLPMVEMALWWLRRQKQQRVN